MRGRQKVVVVVRWGGGGVLFFGHSLIMVFFPKFAIDPAPPPLQLGATE